MKASWGQIVSSLFLCGCYFSGIGVKATSVVYDKSLQFGRKGERKHAFSQCVAPRCCWEPSRTRLKLNSVVCGWRCRRWCGPGWFKLVLLTHKRPNLCVFSHLMLVPSSTLVVWVDVPMWRSGLPFLGWTGSLNLDPFLLVGFPVFVSNYLDWWE